MVVSIEELRMTAMNLRKEGLNSQQIADELSLSQDTISWLLAGSKGEERPSDKEPPTVGIGGKLKDMLEKFFSDDIN